MTTPHDPDDASLARRLAGLPREIEPPRDLWPGIERRLPPRRRGLPRWLPLAAALALVVGAATLALRLRHEAPAATPVVAQEDDGAADLLAALERDPGDLAPETLAALRKNLAVIDTAIAESRRALARDAGDENADRWLRAVQRQRLDLLRQVVRLPRS
jgi:hypothetical protein